MFKTTNFNRFHRELRGVIDKVLNARIRNPDKNVLDAKLPMRNIFKKIF